MDRVKDININNSLNGQKRECKRVRACIVVCRTLFITMEQDTRTRMNMCVCVYGCSGMMIYVPDTYTHMYESVYVALAAVSTGTIDVIVSYKNQIYNKLHAAVPVENKYSRCVARFEI